jgi:hypothetical protein
MYGEEWNEAQSKLNNARKLAIRIHDKARIDTMLDLLRKCKNGGKVEPT